jgi:colanic acid biosynthesis glycosyl transferase WcaI
MTEMFRDSEAPSPRPPLGGGGSKSAPLVLVFSQVFVPDPAAVGQHMTDIAVAMARRGHRVRVYCSARGFEDPSLKYPRRENMEGADVRRLPFSSFGKKNLLTRGMGTLSLLIQFFFIGLFTPNVGGIFFSTSPPFIGFACALISMIRATPIAYWAMDLNPDQIIAMGKIKPNSLSAIVLEKVNRLILRRSALIIALDRFMAERIKSRGIAESKILVLPPWSPEEHMGMIDHASNPFRLKHELAGKFVIMYSGNHSPANPLKTLLDATLHFREDESLRFFFVGGGGGKKEVDVLIAEQKLTNVISLPYQSLADLKYSLSAADIHVVSLGGDMVGIIHPCKIYGAMAIGRPILYFGPQPSHVSDILEQHAIGWHVPHGDVPAAIRAIETARATSREELTTIGKRASSVIQENNSQSVLSSRLCEALENVFHLAVGQTASADSRHSTSAEIPGGR